MSDLYQIFGQLCDDEDDFILANDLKTFFEMIKKPYYQRYIDYILKESGIGNKDTYTFEEVQILIDPKWINEESRTILQDCFRVFVKRIDDRIDNFLLQEILMKYGQNKFSNQEMRQISSCIQYDQDGLIDFKHLVELLLMYQKSTIVNI